VNPALPSSEARFELLYRTGLRPFLAELGSAHLGKPGYQTYNFLKLSVVRGITGLDRPTKHTLCIRCVPHRKERLQILENCKTSMAPILQMLYIESKIALFEPLKQKLFHHNKKKEKEPVNKKNR
jgi:hypothetical protein